MTTSVIILTHNQLRYTKRCIESLLRTSKVDEIVFVENGSTDGTLEFLQSTISSASIPITLIQNDRNLGGGKGRNQGVLAAGGECLVFLDNDAYALTTDWVERLIRPLATEIRVCATAPMLVYPPDGGIIQSAGGGATAAGHFGLLGRGLPVNTAIYSEPRELGWAPTACLACRRDAYTYVGGFDETLDPISIGEDIDFCYRLRAASFRVLFMPDVRVFHYEGSTFNRSSFSVQKKEIFIRNMRQIRRRWMSTISGGPLSSDDDIRYMKIEKNYADIMSPTVTVYPGIMGSYADSSDGLARQ